MAQIDDALWKRIDEHGRILSEHDKRLTMAESECARREKDHKDLMERIIKGEAKVDATMHIVNDKLQVLSNQLSELRGSANTLKWIIPIAVTVIIAGVGATVYIIERI